MGGESPTFFKEKLLRDLIKDTLLLMEEEKKVLAPGGFELKTSIL